MMYDAKQCTIVALLSSLSIATIMLLYSGGWEERVVVVAQMSSFVSGT